MTVEEPSSRFQWLLLRRQTAHYLMHGNKRVVTYGTLLQVGLLVVAAFQFVLAALDGFATSRTEVSRRTVVEASGGSSESAFSTMAERNFGYLPNPHHSILAGVLFACGVLWLFWQWSVVMGLGPGRTAFKPVWHIWGWWIPIVNWVMPVRNVYDLAKAVGQRMKVLLTVWWIAWLSAVSGGFYHFSVGRSEETHPAPGQTVTTYTTTYFDIVWIYTIVAAVCAALIVGRITLAYCTSTDKLSENPVE